MNACSKCDHELPDEKFCKGNGANGLNSWCKDCVNTDAKRRYAAKTPEEKLAIREADNERRRKRVASGGCWTCLNPAEPQKKFCRECLDRHSGVQKRQRERRLAAGFCRECGKNPPRDGSTYCQTCIDGRNARSRELRLAAFAAYGGAVCRCCGETTIQFLTLDHINRDGAEHRKEISNSSWALYLWLKRHRYPVGFQVLCFNCNCGREFNGGICPHQQT